MPAQKPGRPQRKGGHYLVDGIDYPSVTTILSVVNKPALLMWAARQGAKAVLMDPIKFDTPYAAAKAIYDIDGQKATDRGKEAHYVAEEYAKAIIKGTQDQFTSENP